MSSPVPAVAPSPSPTAPNVPSLDGWPGGLTAVRAELDRIDDSVHDLLMRRAEVVAHLVSSGSKQTAARGGQPVRGTALRPGREAAIIRRLLARHTGPLPRQALVRIWRELLAATTAMQGALVVAVCEGDAGAAFTQTAREHFGGLTPLRVYPTAGSAMAEVAVGTASVAVVPYPTDPSSARDAWWTKLLQNDPPRLYVIARLPFWRPRGEGAPAAQALVVAAVAPDPSGQDRSLLGLETAADVSRDRLAAALTEAGFAPLATLLRRDPAARMAQALVEVDGFVTDDDPRFVALQRSALVRAKVLGAYPVPTDGGVA